MKCKECDSEMQLTDIPKVVFEFAIPFFRGFTLQIMNWGNKEYICIECAEEKRDRGYEESYDQGCSDGFMEGVKSAREERY